MVNKIFRHNIFILFCINYIQRDGNTMHHSPLYGPEGAVSISVVLNVYVKCEKILMKVNTIIKYIIGGISPNKLNLGFVTYGN
jgi:hypothetical protein